VGEGDVVVECVGFLSFKNYYLVIGLGETRYCATWCFWLVGDTRYYRVDVTGEGTSDKGNHFLNNMSNIGLE
jgi:hypothetical protein